MPEATDSAKEKSLLLRLDAVREAVSRARFAFLASTIISLTVIVAVWNMYGSWDRFPSLSEKTWQSSGTAVGEAKKQLLLEWVKSTHIAVSLFGISIGVSDLALLGSLSLFIASIWVYFSHRRANRTIGYLLIDTKGQDTEIRTMVIHGVTSYLVFTDIGHSDQPVKTLDQVLDSRAGTPFARLAYYALFFLPSAAIAAILSGDILSLFVLPSPFRESHLPLLWDLMSPQPAHGWVWFKFISMDLMGLVLGVLTIQNCYRALRFELATGQVVRQYDDLLRQRGPGQQLTTLPGATVSSGE